MRHKIWLAKKFIASVPAHVCISNADVAHQSGFRYALCLGRRFSRRDRLLRARFVGSQRGDRPARLRQPVQHRKRGGCAAGAGLPVWNCPSCLGDRLERRTHRGDLAGRDAGVQWRTRWRARRRCRCLPGRIHTPHVSADAARRRGRCPSAAGCAASAARRATTAAGCSASGASAGRCPSPRATSAAGPRRAAARQSWNCECVTIWNAHDRAFSE